MSNKKAVYFCLLFLMLSACAPYHARHKPISYSQQGVASWYGPGFIGKRTASGERYKAYHLTAAHRSLPFGTICKVTNLAAGKSIVVRINDRGPFVGGRLIDLSYAAAKKIGLIAQGTAPVQVVAMAAKPPSYAKKDEF